MYKNAISIISLLILLIAAITPAHSQDNDDPRNRGYGFMMLEEPINPRNIAMGSVGTALGGWGFRYYNPAQPFFSGMSYVSAEFGQMPGGVSKGGFESAMVLPDMFTAFSFYSSSVGFETRDERGEGSPVSSSTTIGSVSAGVIRENLSVALSLNMADDRIWVLDNYRAITLGAGLGYKLAGDKLNLGAAMFHHLAWCRGFGESRSTWGWGGSQVPKFIRAGAAWTDTLQSLPFTVAADVVHSDEDGKLTVPVGLEVNVLPSVSLRIGKRIGWDYEVMSFGLGLNIDRITFDAAFVPTKFVSDYEMKWSMAFTYRLGGGNAQRRNIAPTPASVPVSVQQEKPETPLVEEVVAEEEIVEMEIVEEELPEETEETEETPIEETAEEEFEEEESEESESEKSESDVEAESLESTEEEQPSADEIENGAR
ncbi:MAG: hypothetical protein LBC70_04450 [Chitinispirillales bacterium]|jgi:hypothetical protein|nr:hypothetical protein [Chitinispirillales bacterium]